MQEEDYSPEEYITIQKAAEKFNKSIHNISYLIQYSRINKYYKLSDEAIINAKELKKLKARINGSPLVSVKELRIYFEKIQRKEDEIIKQIPNCNRDLLFFNVTEKERTKHVHRLHPYMGKFIPQLVEYYLDNYFKQNDLILDPFVGSGTTLIEANTKSLKSIGIDISEFNCMITKAKIKNYDLSILEREVNNILNRTEAIYKRLKNKSKKISTTLDSFITDDNTEIDEKLYKKDNEYINKWFATETIKQMLIYSSLIPNYKYQNLLKVLLSRSVRSARLTFHFELTRLKEPIYEPYVCHKHKNKVCAPTQSLLGFLGRYSNDTIKRITEFSKIRTNQPYEIIIGDSGEMDLSGILSEKFNNQKIDGIITSPPYVGLINYHLQHIYAYELFNIKKRIEEEIGRKDVGTSNKAKQDYIEGIAKVFSNVKRFLKEDAVAFIVANDKWNLYPEIACLAGYEIIDRDERPVTKKASRERSFYSESIFHFKPI